MQHRDRPGCAAQFHAQRLQKTTKLVSVHTVLTHYINYTSGSVSAVIMQLHFLTRTKSKGGSGVESVGGVGGGETTFCCISRLCVTRKASGAAMCERMCRWKVTKIFRPVLTCLDEEAKKPPLCSSVPELVYSQQGGGGMLQQYPHNIGSVSFSIFLICNYYSC